jgi:hypothetical protein
MEWIREHPYLTGILAIFLVVLFLVLRSRSSSSQIVQGGPSDALLAAQLQTQVQQQAIQAGATVQIAQTQAQLEAALAATQAAMAQTQAQQAVGLQNIVTGGNVAEYEAAATLQGQQAGYAAATDIAATQAGAGVQTAAIQGQTATQLATIQAPVSLAAIQAQLEAMQSANETSAQIAAAQVAGAESVAATQASVPLAETAAQVTLGSQAISSQQQLLLSQIQAQLEAQQAAYSTLPLVGGSQNRTTIITTPFSPSVGVAAQMSEGATQVAQSSVWGTFWNGLFGAIGASKGPSGTGALALAP